MFRGKRKPAFARIGLVATLALAVVAVAACGGGGSDKPDFNNNAEVFTEKGGDLTVDAQRAFVISLEANPSTGYEWELTEEPDKAIVEFKQQQFVEPEGSAPGTPGTERFRFRALKKGETSFTLRYARPDAPDAPDNLVYTYNVTVQ